MPDKDAGATVASINSFVEDGVGFEIVEYDSPPRSRADARRARRRRRATIRRHGLDAVIRAEWEKPTSQNEAPAAQLVARARRCTTLNVQAVRRPRTRGAGRPAGRRSPGTTSRRGSPGGSEDGEPLSGSVTALIGGAR